MRTIDGKHVCGYVDDPSILNDYKGNVRVGWSSIMPTTIEDARKFANEVLRVCDLAEIEQKSFEGMKCPT